MYFPSHPDYPQQDPSGLSRPNQATRYHPIDQERMGELVYFNFNSDGKHICWYIDSRESVISLKYVSLDTYTLNEFIDPNHSIFGISYPEPSFIRSTFDALYFKDSEYSTNQSKYYSKF